MLRRYRIVLTVVSALLLAVWGIPFAGTSTPGGSWISMPVSVAQESGKKKRRSLFSILFGKKKAKKKSVKKPRVRKKRRKAKSNTSKRRKTKTARKRKKSSSKSRSRKTAAALKTPEKAVVEKTEDAKRILVVGDFFAGGLADGLEKSLSDVPNLVVVEKTNGNSGFVRNDVVDWPATLGPMIEELKPSYVVFLAGTNDRQLMRDTTGKLKKRTPEWDAAYTKRVESLGTVLKASGLPYSWVGLPPVRFKSMNKDFLVFNEMYGKAAKSETGDFIDVWDGFSDAEGNYSRSGPDVNGQIVLLRSKDGINLTKAGRSRLAFYVEDLIVKTLGGREAVASSGIGFDLDFPSTGPTEAVYDPAKTGKTIVVSLDDPSADGGDVLAGEVIDVKETANSKKVQNLVVPVLSTRSNITRYTGRADNFSWPPSDGVTQATPGAVAVSN